MTPSYTPPQFSLPGIRDPRRDYTVLEPFRLNVARLQHLQHAHPEALGSPAGYVVRQVIAYYGLIRDSESLPATYEFAAEAAAPKEIGFGWESRGSPLYSVGLCSRAASLTPVAPKSANDCCFLLGSSLHLLGTGSAITLVVFEAAEFILSLIGLILRPASWLALLSRTFTFELALAGSPRTNVEYDYVGKQSIPTTGLTGKSNGIMGCRPRS